MQFVYVLDFSLPSRHIIKVADNIDVTENIDDILGSYGLKESQCAYMISDKEIDEDYHQGVITKINKQ